jgi:serine/threonine protein kinase
MDGPEDKSKHARYNRIDEGLSSGYLAKGTYGKVYIAEDVQSGQVVAVKRQRYPSEEAAREIAFAKLLRSNPSAPARVST